MIARFDHRPLLMTLALATVVCALLLVVAFFVVVQPAAPPSISNGNPAAHAISGSGSSGYTGAGSLVQRHADVVATYATGDAGSSDYTSAVGRHLEMVAANR